MKAVRTLLKDQGHLPGAINPLSPTLPVTNLDLAPVAVLPEQFFGLSRDHGKGEVALMRAVLEDALNCFVKQFLEDDQRVRRDAKEAEAWFFSPDERWPFSFVNICIVLGLNPQYVRKGLRQWRRQCPAQVKRVKQPLIHRSRWLEIAV